MPYEIDDQGVRLIGYNVPIRFYGPDRSLRCSLYLKPDGTLGSNCEIISRDAGGPGGGDVGSPAAPGLAAVLAGPDIRVDTTLPLSPRIGRGGNTILLYDSGGLPVAEFAASSAGLTAALAAMAAGDVVELPAVTITGGPWTVANGTLRGMSRFGSVLDGLVIVATDAVLERLSVIRSEDDAGAIYCVGLADGARVDGCLISSTNATGDAYGVYSDSDGDCYVNDNIVFAESVGGDGYGYFADGAEMWISGGYVEASTAPVGVG